MFKHGLTFFLASAVFAANADEVDDFFALSIEQLLNVQFTTASGIEENIKTSPSAVVIVSSQDIQTRGYNDLADVIADLPGIDLHYINGSIYSGSNVRGNINFAVPLLMIDGQVQNNLWDLVAVISRQYPLSNIEQIEVIYGPGSAVHGPNALAAIINVITKSGAQLDSGESYAKAQMLFGRYNTRQLELSAAGRQEQWYYAFSARQFESDEPDFSDRLGFLSNALYSSETIWGPILDTKVDNLQLGQYADPTENWGMLARIGYDNTRLSINQWQTSEGYGPYYAADRAQNNVLWHNGSRQYVLENDYSWSSKLQFDTQLMYRVSRIWGNWAEALPDFINDDDTQSVVSFTRWSTYSTARLFKEDFVYHNSPTLTINGGIKFERKVLTKNYDIPGYFGAFSSTVPITDQGPYGLGAAIALSTDEQYNLVSAPIKKMPSSNMQATYDRGLYLQAVKQQDNAILHLGLRYDKNSIYGSSLNPRLSTIYNFNDHQRIKLSYQEAFLEPSALNLFGGFSGRASAPDLKPQLSENLELIWQQEFDFWQYDMSIYQTRYPKVARLGQTVTNRVLGVEFRSHFEKQLGLPWLQKVEGNFYYTYADTNVSHYVAPAGETTDIAAGGIAPHKFRLGLTLTLSQKLSWDFRLNHDSKYQFLFGSPYRARGDKAPGTTNLNTTLNYRHNNYTFGLRVFNLLNTDNQQAIVYESHAGDDTSQRSQGFVNPLIPMPKRSVYFFLNYRFK